MSESIQEAAEATLREWAAQRTPLSVRGPENPEEHLRRVLVRGVLAERDELRDRLAGLEHLIFATVTNIGYVVDPEDQDGGEPGDPLAANEAIERIARSVLYVRDVLGQHRQFVDVDRWAAGLERLAALDDAESQRDPSDA